MAIVVIDDFDQKPPDTDRPGTSPNCTYVSEGTNVVGGKGGSGDPLPPSVSHGSAVFEELRILLKDTPNLTQPKTERWKDYTQPGFGVQNEILTWMYGQQKVILIGVDTNEYRTDVVTSNILGVVDALRNDFGISRIVLNMSFVIAPCDVGKWLSLADRTGTQLLDEYIAISWTLSELADFRDALDKLAGAPRPSPSPSSNDPLRDELLKPEYVQIQNVLKDATKLAALPEPVRTRLFYSLLSRDTLPSKEPPSKPLNPLATQFLNQINNDALNLWLKGLVNNPATKVIPVAAAGNGIGFDLGDEVAQRAVRPDFPFAPAMWNSVVSASSWNPDKHSDRAFYSNSGEVMLDGHFEFTPPSVGNVLKLDGTSFAAPRLSHKEALYLLTGGPMPCAPHIPPLGYSDLDDSEPSWLNMPLEDAIKSYCSDFNNHGGDGNLPPP